MQANIHAHVQTKMAYPGSEIFQELFKYWQSFDWRFVELMNQYYVVWVRNILKCYNYQTYQRNQQQTGFIIADSSDFPIAQCSRISLFVHFTFINIFIFIDKTQTMQ